VAVRDRVTWIQERNPLPDGTLTVGAGLLINGITAYAFLGLAGRTLGAEAFEPLSVLWAMIYLLSPGFFLPLEQEVSRALANRWARGVGVGPLIHQAGAIGGVLLGGVLVVTLAASPWLLEHLFDDQVLVLLGLLFALAGYAAVHLARGALAGLGRFRGYAAYYVIENSLRLLACAVLVVMGVDTAGPYALAVGLAPAVALLIALRGEHDLLSPGPPAPRGELTAAMGSLLLASVMAAFLLYAGVVAVSLLATDAESGEASVFLAGLAVARVPVFLFQAVQAALLPKLSALAGAGRFADFRGRLRRLLGAVGAVGAAGVLGAFLLGPALIHLLFGPDYDIGRTDLALLALSSAAFMLAVALGQALIALSAQSLVGVGWLVGSITFVVVTLAGDDLFLRVETGMAAGSAAAALAIGILAEIRLHGRLHHEVA
jgi:O-antigen/teichoic acid export membrane protein